MTNMEDNVTSDDIRRRTLAGLASVLIPGGRGMPSAADVDVAGKLTQRLLVVRPELAEPLADLLDWARDRRPDEAVQSLRSQDKHAFAMLSFVVSGAYFLDAQVRASLHYPGPHRSMIRGEEAEEYVDASWLSPVIERGPIWRATPD